MHMSLLKLKSETKVLFEMTQKREIYLTELLHTGEKAVMAG